MTTANLDLRQLAIRREGAPPTPPPRRSRNLLSRYILPGTVLLGFVALLGWAGRDQFLSAKPVTVVPPLTTRAEVQNEGSPQFQAAGWVEPRPTATLVTAVAEGVVDKVFVVEGQRVKAGDVVAELVKADAELGLRAARADRDLRQSELEYARATLSAARTNLGKPAHLHAALGEAEAVLAQKETELTGLPFQLAAAKARAELARLGYQSKQSASAAIAGFQLQQAKSELDGAEATLAELGNREVRLKREVAAQRQKRDALQQRLDLKTDETRQQAEAEANVRSAEARLRQAEAALDAAALRLERMTVRAPADGQVLALLARPGTRVMGLAPGSLQDASTLVSLYDPAQLQVRADVRLEDVSRVQSGQKVRIETAAVPGGPLEGEVLQATSQADIQKNTLQIKVAVHNPPAALRPDMLVQVTFLAPPAPKASGAETQALRLLIPRQLVESGEGGTRVWLADRAAGVARARGVKLGQASADLVEVVDGLVVTDRLISGGREGLRDGQRITVAGEDASQAATPASKAPAPPRAPAADKGQPQQRKR